VQLYDLLIIGGGPAGLAAGIYGARARLKTAILEKGALGGMAFRSRAIVNYPGFFQDVSGPSLVQAMSAHAQKFGVTILEEEVAEASFAPAMKIIKTSKGNLYTGRAVILACGSQPRLLNIPGEEFFSGNGVSYCATCDAQFYEGMTVVVVGSGDAAIEEACYITKYARKVMVVVMHDEGIVDCNKAGAEKAFQNNKIEFIWNSILTVIKGKNEVESVIVKNLKTGNEKELKAEGVFIYVGMAPHTEFLKGKIALDEDGHIITNEIMETTVAGVFAAGDVRNKYLRQVVTAVSDGAVAAVAAERYLREEDDLKGLLQSPEPVLLFFWSPYHEKSVKILPEFEQLAAGIGNKCRLIKVDVSRKQRLAKRYNITTIPSVLLLKGGKANCKVVKDFPEDLMDMINSIC